MGFDALTAGLLMGGIGAASSFMGSMGNSANQRMQAATMEANAEQMRNQAKLIEAEGQIRNREVDKQRHELGRQYRHQQAANNVSLGVGNVDAASGSAMQVAEGNATSFAYDTGENYFQRRLNDWETGERAKQARFQADSLDSQSSYLKQTAGNIGSSLLTAGLSGASGFLSGYTMAGGKLFSDKWQTLWDSGEGDKLLTMRHPSGKITKI